MREMRLALCQPDGCGREAIASRLHGTTVIQCVDSSQVNGSPTHCNAAMFTSLPESDIVESYLSARMHVLLVAEPCPSSRVIEALFASARKAGVQLSLVNPDRYLPSRRLIHKQLSGPLGEPGLLRLHHWEPTPTVNSTDPMSVPEPLLRDLDVALWLMGMRPDRVYAIEQKHDGSPGRCMQVHLGFPGGGMALLDFNNRLPAGGGYQSLSVIAASGAAYADDQQNMQLVYRGGCPEAVRTEERTGQLATMAQEFVDAIRTDRDLMTANAASWRDVFAVADAVVRSLTTGRSVMLEDR